MSYFIENEYGDIEISDYEKVINDIIDGALDFIECPYECEVNVLLTDNASIHEINNQQRNIDRPTDVLSFPLIDYKTPGDFSIVESAVSDYFNPESGELLLGDIVISIDKVYEQAREYNHSVHRELAFLVAHSMLHLFGYDHMTPEDAAIMEPKQREILEAMNISREE